MGTMEATSSPTLFSSAPPVTGEGGEPVTIDRQSYRIGSLQLVIRFEDASELSAMPAISRLPGAPDGVLGLTNLHGNIVPVFDIAMWLGFAHDEHKTPMVLVCGYGEEAVGIVIDGLPDRKKFLPGEVITLDRVDPALGLFSRAAFADATGVWVELDTRRLFTEFTRSTNQ